MDVFPLVAVLLSGSLMLALRVVAAWNLGDHQ